MTISIPDLTVSFASHLPDDVTEIHVTRTGDGLVLFHVVKGDLTVNYAESETAIELCKVDMGVIAAKTVNAHFDEYARNPVLGLSHDRP